MATTTVKRRGALRWCFLVLVFAEPGTSRPASAVLSALRCYQEPQLATFGYEGSLLRKAGEARYLPTRELREVRYAHSAWHYLHTRLLSHMQY
eukprot:19497-Rhodomonas_salina.2